MRQKTQKEPQQKPEAVIPGLSWRLYGSQKPSLHLASHSASRSTMAAMAAAITNTFQITRWQTVFSPSTKACQKHELILSHKTYQPESTHMATPRCKVYGRQHLQVGFIDTLNKLLLLSKRENRYFQITRRLCPLGYVFLNSDDLSRICHGH